MALATNYPRAFGGMIAHPHSINVSSTIDDLALSGKRYVFKEWSGLSSSTSNNMTFTVSALGILTANYET